MPASAEAECYQGNRALKYKVTTAFRSLWTGIHEENRSSRLLL